MIIDILSSALRPIKHVRDTGKAVSELQISDALTSYVKSVPGAIAIANASQPVGNLVASQLLKPTAGKVAVKSAQAVRSAATWWLRPAAVLKNQSQQTFANIAKKAGISSAKLAGVATAVVGGEHLLAKLARSTSTIDYVRGIFSKKHAHKQFGQKRNFVQGTVDLLLAGPIRRGYLRLIHGKPKGGEEYARK